MAYIVKWDTKYNRPTLGGKVQNPETGQIEDVTSKSFWAGPPCVDVIWHNLHAESDFKTVRASFSATIDEVYLEVANHIRDKIYSIVSISASAYSFTVICATDKTQEQFNEVQVRMRRQLERVPERSVDGGHLPPDQ